MRFTASVAAFSSFSFLAGCAHEGEDTSSSAGPRLGEVHVLDILCEDMDQMGGVSDAMPTEGLVISAMYCSERGNCWSAYDVDWSSSPDGGIRVSCPSPDVVIRVIWAPL